MAATQNLNFDLELPEAAAPGRYRFLGMHALQLFPLAGFALSSPAMARFVARPLVWLGAIVALYSLFNLFVFAEALAGRPLVAL